MTLLQKIAVANSDKTVKAILARVAQHFKRDASAFQLQSRKNVIVDMRMIACAILTDKTHLTQKEMIKVLGRKHHTDIIHYRRRCKERHDTHELGFIDDLNACRLLCEERIKKEVLGL